jgi:hypothetical protein
MQYVAPAADAPRPGAPTAGIDDPVDRPVPVNGPPASSPAQLPLFAAPRSPQGTYWSLLSPSGALLPATQASYQQPRAIVDLQRPPAPAPPPDVPLTVNNVVRSIATGVPIAGGLANKGNAAINAALAPLMNPLFEERNQLKGDTWSERYRNSLDEQNAADQAFHAAHPKLDTGLQIGGGIAATAPLAATATGARLLGLTGSLPGMVVRSASSNAAISAADAAVRGQDVPLRVSAACSAPARRWSAAWSAPRPRQSSTGCAASSTRARRRRAGQGARSTGTSPTARPGSHRNSSEPGSQPQARRQLRRHPG